MEGNITPEKGKDSNAKRTGSQEAFFPIDRKQRQ
jgi:hypothetical protein